MAVTKQEVQDKVDQKLEEVLATLEKCWKYFGVKFDPNDEAVYQEIKNQIYKIEHYPNGQKKPRAQIRRDVKANRKRLDAQRRKKSVKSLT